MAAKRNDVDAGDLGIVDPETASAGTGEGNPSGAGDNGNIGTGNDDGIKRNKDGSIRKKRGRKPGQSGASRKSDLSVSGVEKILVSLHTMASVRFSAPELMLDDAEAKAMSEGILAVQSHYNFSASAEVMAWANLAFILFGIYGPRVMLIHERKKDEKSKNKSKGEKIDSPNVTSLYPDGLIVPHHAPTE